MIKVTLTCLVVLLLAGLYFEKKGKGDFENPVVLPEESLAEITPFHDKLEKTDVRVMAFPRNQEDSEMLCISINNQSDYTLVEIKCELTNLTRNYRDIFILRPVSGKWISRNGFRKYFAEPKGIHLWSGNFGSHLNLKDRFEIKLLKAYGLKP